MTRGGKALELEKNSAEKPEVLGGIGLTDVGKKPVVRHGQRETYRANAKKAPAEGK